MTRPIELVRAYIAADVPVLLWGPPGVGKTAALRAEAEDAGALVVTLIGSTLDPIDVGGYLLPDRGQVVCSPPPWAQEIRGALDESKRVWLFLDELGCALPAVQAALLRVVHERRVGPVDLSGCSVVAASNRGDTAADGGELPAAQANRWAHVEWPPDPDGWIAGTLSGWGRGYSAIAETTIACSVAEWVRRQPAALLAVPDGADASGPWPSPRSWTHGIRAAAMAPTMARALMAGLIGAAAAAEWHTYHVARDLPDPEDLLAGRACLPDRGDRIAACLGSVVAAAGLARPDREARVAAAWRLLSGVRPDVARLAGSALGDLDPDLIPEEAVALGQRIISLRDRTSAVAG